jgi:hypothetical protein
MRGLLKRMEFVGGLPSQHNRLGDGIAEVVLVTLNCRSSPRETARSRRAYDYVDCSE